MILHRAHAEDLLTMYVFASDRLDIVLAIHVVTSPQRLGSVVERLRPVVNSGQGGD